jgi:SAM-dependent methyltransferase
MNDEQDVRPRDFFRVVPAPRRILELGSCTGAGTFQLARHPGVEEVVAIEGRDYNVEQAQRAQEMLGIMNVRFLEANLESFDLTVFGRFDAVYCVGLLYHLPRPWELLSKLETVTDVLYINTHYCPINQRALCINGYAGAKWREFGWEDPLSGLSSWSFWPTLKSLTVMLIDSGFTPEIFDTDTTGPGQSPHGTTILARRTASVPSGDNVRLFQRMNDVLSSLRTSDGDQVGRFGAPALRRALSGLLKLRSRIGTRRAQEARA